jgi:acyl carrier protein
MKEKIIDVIDQAMPNADIKANYLYNSVDSLGLLIIAQALSNEFNINIDSDDLNPKNFRNVENLEKLIKSKMNQSA